MRRDSPVVRDEALAQAELAEDVHDDLHGRVICDSEGTHVQDAAQLQGTRAVSRERRGMLREIHARVQHDAFLLPLCVLCGTRPGKENQPYRLKQSKRSTAIQFFIIL